MPALTHIPKLTRPLLDLRWENPVLLSDPLAIPFALLRSVSGTLKNRTTADQRHSVTSAPGCVSNRIARHKWELHGRILIGEPCPDPCPVRP